MFFKNELFRVFRYSVLDGSYKYKQTGFQNFCHSTNILKSANIWAILILIKFYSVITEYHVVSYSKGDFKSETTGNKRVKMEIVWPTHESRNFDDMHCILQGQMYRILSQEGESRSVLNYVLSLVINIIFKF